MRGSAAEVLELLRDYLPALHPSGVAAAYLFGSHAEGRAHAESDFDLGVLFDFQALPSRKARFDRSLELSSSLATALHTDRVDLIILNDAPPGLGARIVGEGERVYVSDPEAEHAFRRDVQLRAADLIPFIARTSRLKLESLGR